MLYLSECSYLWSSAFDYAVVVVFRLPELIMLCGLVSLQHYFINRFLQHLLASSGCAEWLQFDLNCIGSSQVAFKWGISALSPSYTNRSIRRGLKFVFCCLTWPYTLPQHTYKTTCRQIYNLFCYLPLNLLTTSVCWRLPRPILTHVCGIVSNINLWTEVLQINTTA